jgi:hypothetical protein
MTSNKSKRIGKSNNGWQASDFVGAFGGFSGLTCSCCATVRYVIVSQTEQQTDVSAIRYPWELCKVSPCR